MEFRAGSKYLRHKITLALSFFAEKTNMVRPKFFESENKINSKPSTLQRVYYK
jgi:hypothetical protein